ncbi:MAG TPA: MarP family serine protease [Solirubrobacteraceae bacterium]|jgi:S1-C subfamily serine protease|nr:MarP family serine protease [Solirubrobacteraceae bacterium]
MTGLDWLIVAFACLLAVFGFRRGFIVAMLSFGGFAIGSFIGTRLGPLLLSQGSTSRYAPAFGLIGALLAGAILATGFEGIGLRLRRLLAFPGLSLLDGALGAMLSAALGLAIAWILAAVVLQSQPAPRLRADVERSEILRKLNQLLPPTGPILGVLASLDPLPRVSGPLPSGSPPSSAIARDPAIRAASRSVVRVLGTACGLAIEGSGWVAAPGVVVTNAHVVAGEHDTTVEVHGSEPQLSAYAIAFDPTDDVAVLHVPGLDLPSLSLAASSPEGTPGAVLGYPENGPLDARAARIGATQRILTDDAYGNGTVSRLLTPLRGLVRPGNSGGPLVDRAGRVLTTVFASTSGGGADGGYGVANATVARVLQGAGSMVGTGECSAG